VTATATRDWSLTSGERQVAPSVAAVRADHRARYDWAARMVGIRPHASGLDVFCGTGYGTLIMATEVRCPVLGIDGSSEAVRFATERFSNPFTFFASKVFPFDLPFAAYDFVTCFESIEHVDNGLGMLRELARAVKPGGWLFVSTPSIKLPVYAFPWHTKHFTQLEIRQRLPDFALVEWHGQFQRERELGTMHLETDADFSVMAFRKEAR
jgi:2-polyprenyl-3-methyl-5-hydroxy-6-metoxy-1,4-benzoquinol methylase